MISILTLASVYIAEYGFGLRPCQLCNWQRVPWFILLGLSLIALLPSWSSKIRIQFIALMMIIMAASLCLALFHVGVEYGWWKGLTTCSQAAEYVREAGKAPSLADILAKAEKSPPIPCDKPIFTLFGVSFAGFNFLLSGALVVFLSLSLKQSLQKSYK